MNTFTNHELQGLSKDRQFESDQEVTFALNAIKNSHDGSIPFYQSEAGNEISKTFSPGYSVIGNIYGNDNNVYLFVTNNSVSEIGVYKEGRYTTLVNTTALGFNKNFPITGEFRIINGCDPILYWTDNNNPDRWFDVNNPDKFKTSGNWDSEKFKFRPTVKVPRIDLHEVNDSGGNLPVGSYYFQFELLDANQNVIYKTDITPQTVIYDDSIQTSYGNIDGAVNYPQFDQLSGGVLATTKSITLQLSNLDTSQKWLRVNVAYQTSGTQVLQAHTVSTLIPISDSSQFWTYVGFNPNAGDSLIDFSSMLPYLDNYETSYVMEQIQNRLVRANLKSNPKDYSTYQAVASEITTKWVASEVEAKNPQSIGNPKNPQTYWIKSTFQGDEVYAFTVQYLHDDGTWSPMFLISGREAVSTDTQLLTVVANGSSLGANDVWLSDVEHLGLSIGQTIPRWKVFNTATITSSQTTTHPYTYKGDFAYYEADFNYPDIRDCENNLIWGAGITTSQKVRFHKFPDRRLVSHINSSDYIVPLGVEFTVTTYPPGVIGHRFGMITRDQFNQTVADSGWLTQPDWVDTFSGIDYAHLTAYEMDFNLAQTEGYARFTSSKVLFNNVLEQSSFYKLNKVFRFKSPDLVGSTYPYFNVDLTDPAAFDGKLYSIIMPMKYNSQGLPVRTNHKIERSVFVGVGTEISVGEFDIKVKTNDWFTPNSLSKISYGLENSEIVIPSQSYGLSPDEDEAFLNANNFYGYKKTTNNIYQGFLNLPCNYLHFNPYYNPQITHVYGGDTLLVNSQCFRSIVLPVATIDVSVDRFAHATHWVDRWEEQPFNSNLRYGGTQIENQYYKDSVGDMHNILKVATVNPENPGEYYIREEFDRVAEYYKLNNDYSLQKVQQLKTQIPQSFNYCSECLNYYPNRIIFSPVSFDEELTDQYRVLYTNDYIDIPAHRGQITGLQYTGDNLLVHCEDATFILRPNPQVVATDQSQAYLTTGDFLSIPPVELMRTDLGYAGCQSKQHQLNTPFGYVWVDQRRGNIFKFTNTIENISQIGLEQWFKENLPSELQRDVWKSDGVKYPYLTTTEDLGVGLILYYDPRYKRLIITKQDYAYYLLPTDTGVIKYNNGSWAYQTNVSETIRAFESRYFENKAWTLSFDFNYNRWISYHSYRPYFAFSDDFNFYTLNRGNPSIWKHLDRTKYQNFYGTKFDFILEVINNKLQTDRLHSVHYEGYTYQWDALSKQWLEIPETFNKFIAYNHNQSTGKQNITLLTNPYQNVKLTGNTKYAIKTDQNYKISGLFDMSVNQPVLTSHWQDVQTYGSFIDVVDTNIDFNKSRYLASDVWDKYVYVRLFAKPTVDAKVLVTAIQLNKQYSIR